MDKACFKLVSLPICSELKLKKIFFSMCRKLRNSLYHFLSVHEYFDFLFFCSFSEYSIKSGRTAARTGQPFGECRNATSCKQRRTGELVPCNHRRAGMCESDFASY